MTSTLVPPADSTRRYGASSLGGLATLYLLTLRQYLHGKRWMVMGLLFLLPAGLAILVRSTAPDAPPPLMLEFLLAMMFIPQLLLPVTALLYASGMVQDEQEDQTITYLLIRPLPKWAIYVTKLLATLTATIALVAVFTALTYAAIYIGADAPADAEGPGVAGRCLRAISVHSLGVTAYCCIFGLMGLVTKRTLVIGIVYTAVVEGLLANMPFGIRLITVIYYTRLIAYRLLPFVVEFPGGGRRENMAAEAWQLGVRRDPTLADHPQFATCIAVLLIASLACSIAAAWICSRREFHVKTPEKG